MLRLGWSEFRVASNQSLPSMIYLHRISGRVELGLETEQESGRETEGWTATPTKSQTQSGEAPSAIAPEHLVAPGNWIPLD